MEKIDNCLTGYTSENTLSCLTENVTGKLTPYLWQDFGQMEDTVFFTTVNRKENVFYQKVNVHIHNLSNQPLAFKLFFVCESVKDVSASFYSPADAYIYMYGKNLVSLFNGTGGNRMELSVLEKRHEEAVYKMMERGQLIHSPLARGKVICMIMHEVLVNPGEKRNISSWQINSHSKEEAWLLDWLIENQTSNSD